MSDTNSLNPRAAEVNNLALEVRPRRREAFARPEGDPPVDTSRPLDPADRDAPRTRAIAGLFCATHGYRPNRVRVGTRPAGGERGRIAASVEAVRGDGRATGFACVVAAENAEWALDDLLKRVAHDAQKRSAFIRSELAAYHAGFNPQSVHQPGDASPAHADGQKTTTWHLANVEAKSRAYQAAKSDLEAATDALTAHIKAGGQ